MAGGERPMTGTTGGGRDLILAPLEESGIRGFHFRTWITAGMGFFTDAYDLFIIGVVTSLLATLWRLTTYQTMWLNGTALLAAALGAVLFGRLMDRWGRKAVYGLEAALMAAGALMSALSPNWYLLLATRFIVGLGVGGDYPMSAVLMSEYSNRRNRGLLVTMVFAMQGIGLLAGPAVTAGLLAAGVPADLAWRLMLGLGAIPAAAVIYLRRRMPETPHFTLSVRGETEAATELVERLTGLRPTAPGRVLTLDRDARVLFREPLFLVTLLGTAGSWFLLDAAFYGNAVSTSLVLKTLLPHGGLLSNTLVAAAVFLVAAVPGYWLAACAIDRLGRVFMQTLGFAVMGAAYLVLALAPGLVAMPAVFLIVYAISYFFIEFGPNVTTFVIPAEVFPVTFRGWGHGLSAAVGKLGAFLGVFLFPLLLLRIHLPGIMEIMAAISVLGLLLTRLTLGEGRGLTLREASHEALLERASHVDAAGALLFSRARSLEGAAAKLAAVPSLAGTVTEEVHRHLAAALGESRRQEEMTDGAAQGSAAVSGALDKLARHSEETVVLAEEATMVAREGIEAALRQASRVAQQEEKARGLLLGLEALRQQLGVIDELVEVLMEVAEETNLLALNAAIQAARAGGPEGRAFAVVSAEVRRLADRSARAAKEVGGRAENTLRRVGETVEAWRAFEAELAEDSRFAEGMSVRLRRTMELSLTVSEAMQEVAAGAEEVAAGQSQQDEAVGRVTQSARRVSQAAAGAASAVEGLAVLRATAAAALEEASRVRDDLEDTAKTLERRAEQATGGTQAMLAALLAFEPER